MIQELRKENERLKATSSTQSELSKENAQLKTQNVKLEMKATDMEASLKKIRHEAQIAAAVTKMFEQLTGITATYLGDSKFECHCTTKNQTGLIY